jgi:hypothetical protein
MEVVIANKDSLLRELEQTVKSWVDRSFNFLPLQVVEKMSDNCLHDFIVQPDKRLYLFEYLDDCDETILILDYCQQNDIDDEDERLSKYIKHEGTIKQSFIDCINEDFDSFCDFVLEEYESDIEDFISEKNGENYPMWNTCFEWRDSYRNEDETNEKVINVGCGVIEGLEPFNNLIFMTSAGHSFYSSYWIPLYFRLFPNEEEKYKGIDYSSL